WIHAAHDLDEDVDRRVAEHGFGVRGEARAVEIRHPLLLGVADQDAHDFERGADALGQIVGVRAKELHDAAAHGSATEKANPDRIHRGGVYYTGVAPCRACPTPIRTNSSAKVPRSARGR